MIFTKKIRSGHLGLLKEERSQRCRQFVGMCCNCVHCFGGGGWGKVGWGVGGIEEKKWHEVNK